MTVLDPFQQKYGKALTAGLSLVSLCLDMFWVPATLTGLGLLFTSIKWVSPCTRGNTSWVSSATGSNILEQSDVYSLDNTSTVRDRDTTKREDGKKCFDLGSWLPTSADNAYSYQTKEKMLRESGP